MDMPYDTDDARWAAVVARDRAADGRFWCGVVTTGIYCRPQCSARPRRQNVRFFETREAARAAGLRACKRCRPDQDEGASSRDGGRRDHHEAGPAAQ